MEVLGDDNSMQGSYPAIKSLLEVREDSEQLSEKKVELFH